jgi:metal-responsive CopG/Arc/MetJ family transcriptional regulator
MKARITITLSKTVLARIDRLVGSKRSRSAFIEHIMRQHLLESAGRADHARDLARINAAAARLNAEALDVLNYQSLKSRP